MLQAAFRGDGRTGAQVLAETELAAWQKRSS